MNQIKQSNQEEEIALLVAAVHSSHDSIVITDTELSYPGPKIVFVNKSFTKMTGYEEKEIIGKTPRILQGPNTQQTVFRDLKKKLKKGEVFFGEAINYRKDGTEFYNQWHIEPILNKEGKITNYLAVQRDVTDEKKAQQQLIYDANHDSLTKLYNRSWFLEKLQHCLDKNQNYQDYLFALLFLDLDGFKWINDSLGHSAGDRFLQEVAARITQSIRSKDFVARLGGDEFTIIIDNVKDLAIISSISDRIQQNLQKPFMIDSQEVFTSVSTGITLSNMNYDHGEEMLRDTDLAMYRAKTLGKSRAVIFNQTMRKVAVERLNLERDLHNALEREEFEVYYQPIINVIRQEIVGFEALIRWHHPEKGFVSPAQFIPLAEETGMIVQIGEWVLKKACLQSCAWQKSFASQYWFINVNISPRQFKQFDLVEKVEQILKSTKCDRSLIKLEITESAILETDDKADTMLDQLSNLGIKLCLDDFGTGYSSLSRLYQFPIDVLKIDGCFIRAIGKNEKKEKILTNIISLAHALDMEVVAEGVETEFQYNTLCEYGCEYVQGYLFSKPASSKKIESLLRKKFPQAK